MEGEITSAEDVHSRLEEILQPNNFDEMLNEVRDYPFMLPSKNGTRTAIMDNWISKKGIVPALYYEFKEEGGEDRALAVLGLDEARFDENVTLDDVYTMNMDDFDMIMPETLKKEGISSTNVLLFLCPMDYIHKLRPYVLDPGEVFSFYREREQGERKEAEVYEDTTEGKMMLENIVSKAIKIKASDIHLETNHGNYRIRFRVDGKLLVNTAIHSTTQEEIDKISHKSYKQVIGAIKATGDGIKHHEHRLPQDGKYEIPKEILRQHRISGDYQFRVATVPTPYGEDVVMRLHEKGRPMPLEELGFIPEITDSLARLSGRSHGLILATGPTGSGKTTTLYSMIQRVNHPDKKIITFEDPIERDVMGLEQIQVRPDIDVTFARMTSAALRYDPDIMLIGEMKDDETAEAAIRAALTGHLVYSTLHTNDAASTILRLARMLPDGGEVDMQATLRAVLAQRLVRLINHKDVEEGDISPYLTELTRVTFDYPIKLLCPKSDSSYKGRLPLGELFIINDEARDHIVQRDFSISTYKRIARESGMINMFESGLRKVIDGSTSINEIVRLMGEDEFRDQGQFVKDVFDKHYYDKR